MQIVLDDGVTAEIQIMPRPIMEVYDKDHANYSKWRNKKDWSPEDRRQAQAERTWAQGAYAKAYENWLGMAPETP